MTPDAPFSYPFDLSSLSERGGEVSFEIPAAAREAIAVLFEIDGIDAVSAVLRLARESTNEYVVEGSFRANVLQTCIVTLEPVRSSLSGEFTRRYRTVPQSRLRKIASDLEMVAGDDEIETLKGSSLDLAVPVLEELSLAIDPYPRAPGAEFIGGGDDEPQEENPFAVLQKLKGGGKPPETT